MLRSTLLQGWTADIATLRTRALALTDGLTPAQLAQRPANGGWSIAMVFEHLLVSDGLYTDVVARALAGAKNTGTTDDWRPSWIGGFMARMLDPQSAKKLSAPRKMQPGPTPRPNVVAAYVAALDGLDSVVARADGLPLRTIKLSSPVMPLVRMNLGDALRIAIVHSQRHLAQVERVRREVVGA
jgi:hypothetical protein